MRVRLFSSAWGYPSQMAFDLQDLTELAKRFEHIPTEAHRLEQEHQAVANQLVSTAKSLLNLIPYGQEAETFVTKLVSAGEEIHTALDKAPPGVSTALGKIVQETPSPDDGAGAAPVVGSQPAAPAPVPS